MPVQSIIDKFIGRFKTLMGPFMIPMFSIDDNPPTYEDGWTVPAMIDRITRGVVVHLINVEELATAIATAMGGGAGATEAKQDEQITQLATLISNTTGLSTEATLALIKTAVESSDATLTSIASTVATEATTQQIRDALAPLTTAATESTVATLATEATAQDILTALGPLATSVDVQAVTTAITALANGSSINDVVTALTPLASVATETTAAAILSSAQAMELDIDTIRSTLVTIESNTDDLETYALATQNNTSTTATNTGNVATYTAPSSSGPTNYNVTPTSTTTALSSAACRRVTLISSDTNDTSAYIYVGGSAVDSTSSPPIGTPLGAGDSITYAVTNANLISHACSTASQVLRVEVLP